QRLLLDAGDLVQERDELPGIYRAAEAAPGDLQHPQPLPLSAVGLPERAPEPGVLEPKLKDAPQSEDLSRNAPRDPIPDLRDFPGDLCSGRLRRSPQRALLGPDGSFWLSSPKLQPRQGVQDGAIPCGDPPAQVA